MFVCPKDWIRRLATGIACPAVSARLVLAGATWRKPSLIVLDEATNALDYESETAFHEVIQNMRGQVAVVLIAHRLTTVRMADRTLVLQGGMVLEQGTIDELVNKKNGYLAGMVAVE